MVTLEECSTPIPRDSYVGESPRISPLPNNNNNDNNNSSIKLLMQQSSSNSNFA